jgi:hypothetical protein
LRAISDAASYDERVEKVYGFGLLERLTVAVAARIANDVGAGISPPDLVPEETARALVFMTERYLIDAYGRPVAGQPRDNAAVLRTLQAVWIRTLYGPEPEGL